jgi:transcriptional regulator with XRE-family HTH domain
MEVIDGMTIGERIKERRKELGMSVDELAEILGKNRATVYRYESDDIENLSITVLDPLAKALKTSPEHLMGWDEEPVKTMKEDPSFKLQMQLMDYFQFLNDDGMEEALKRIRELTRLPEYCKKVDE